MSYKDIHEYNSAKSEDAVQMSHLSFHLQRVHLFLVEYFRNPCEMSEKKLPLKHCQYLHAFDKPTKNIELQKMNRIQIETES